MACPTTCFTPQRGSLVLTRRATLRDCGGGRGRGGETRGKGERETVRRERGERIGGEREGGRRWREEEEMGGRSLSIKIV